MRAPGPEALVLWESSVQKEGFGKAGGREVGWSPRAPLLGIRAKERGGCHGDGEASDGGTNHLLCPWCPAGPRWESGWASEAGYPRPLGV